MKIFKENLKYLLKVHDMSISDLAERLNISQPAVSKFLNPESDALPTVQNIVRISRILGVKIDDLLTLDLSDPTAKTNEDSIQEKIDSAILSLERIRDDIKKSGKKKGDPKPPKGGALVGLVPFMSLV